ncbi:MAG: enoyl-CoA hydratase/isomerase family protein [Planctomycetota bacterium]
MAELPVAEVRAERDGAALRLILDAQERGNSLDAAMLARLAELLGEAAADPEVRVVVLEGAGTRSFSTGYHVPSLLAELERGPSVSDFEDHPLERALRALEALPQPSVAVVRGNAYGAGCELALATDLRLAARDARFCMPPARLGVLYSATGTRRLLELVGPALTRELLFTACVVDAERALAIGLVNRLAAPEALDGAARGLIGEIEANAPLSLRHHKTILSRFLAAAPLDQQTLTEVAQLREECFRSPEFARRAARLAGRGGPPREPESGGRSA